jgi:PIN domain nuclease of toxin-antitoxin system
MRLLIDTHAFLWFLAGDSKLRVPARRRIEDSRNERFLSIASVWEMAIKLSLGKLRLEDPLEDVVTRGTVETGIALLAISKDHAIRVATLPWYHHDPFDRLLIAQALEEDLAVLTRDDAFESYSVRRVF